MAARHLESPNEATNATKLKLAAADQKTWPLPPAGPLAACPLGDYVRPCSVALTNLVVGMAHLSVRSVCQFVFQAFSAESSAALTGLALWPWAPCPPFTGCLGGGTTRTGTRDRVELGPPPSPSNGQGPAPHLEHLLHLQPRQHG